MKLRYPALAGLLLVMEVAAAGSFEAAGVIQRVDVEHNLIEVDDQLYELSNQVTESGNPGGGPALFQLRAGMSLSFSGDTGARPIIRSVYIHDSHDYINRPKP
ncbi:MAG: PilY2 family type 4a fimbrial biogenesis protein [Pseudomonas oryzihabitans]